MVYFYILRLLCRMHLQPNKKLVVLYSIMDRFEDASTCPIVGYPYVILEVASLHLCWDILCLEDGLLQAFIALLSQHLIELATYPCAAEEQQHEATHLSTTEKLLRSLPDRISTFLNEAVLLTMSDSILHR